MRWLNGITDSMDVSLSKLWEMVKNMEACPGQACCSPWDRQKSDTTQQLNNKEKKETTLSPSDVDTATRKWLLPRHQIPHILTLDLPSSRTVRNKYFLIATKSLLFVLSVLTDKKSNTCLLRKKKQKKKRKRSQRTSTSGSIWLSHPQFSPRAWAQSKYSYIEKKGAHTGLVE